MNLELTDIQADQLRETLHIAASRATVALSKLTNQKITVGLPEILIDRIENIAPREDGGEQLSAGIVFRLSGELPGAMLIDLPEQNALALAGLMTQHAKTHVRDLDRLDISALEEMGNIVAGHAITALWNFLGTPIRYSPPASAVDLTTAIIEQVVTDIGSKTSEAMVFNASFSLADNVAPNRLIFIFTPAASRRILEIIKTRFDAGKNH